MNQEQLNKLLLPLPPEAITQHESKKFLSSIKAIYVTERFNEVFGTGKWRTKVEHVTTQQRKEGAKVGDMVVVKLTFEVPEENIYYEAYGGNNNEDLGDAFKGAMTDAITKVGSYLGVGIDVFKGKAGKTTDTTYPKTVNEVVTQEGDVKRTCPHCQKVHTGKFPKCIDCWKKEQAGEKLTTTKTLTNTSQPPF